MVLLQAAKGMNGCHGSWAWDWGLCIRGVLGSVLAFFRECRPEEILCTFSVREGIRESDSVTHDAVFYRKILKLGATMWPCVPIVCFHFRTNNSNFMENTEYILIFYIKYYNTEKVL